MPGAPDTQALLAALHRTYVPHKTLVLIDPQRAEAALAALPLLREVMAGKTQIDGKATVPTSATTSRARCPLPSLGKLDGAGGPVCRVRGKGNRATRTGDSRMGVRPIAVPDGITRGAAVRAVGLLHCQVWAL